MRDKKMKINDDSSLNENLEDDNSG